MSARTTVPSLAPAALAACLAAVAALVSTPVAHAGAWLPAPGDYQTTFTTSMFSADTWRDESNQRLQLDGGGFWEQRQLTATTEMGWKKGRSFFLSIPFTSVTRRVDSPEGWNRTESGLGDLVVGFRFKLHQKESAVSLDLSWKAPLGYERDLAARDALGNKLTVTGAPGDSAKPAVAQYPATLGLGQQDLQATLNIGTPLAKRGFLDLAAGYRYRGEAPADQFVSRADLGLWFGSRILAGGRYVGEIAVGDGDTPGDKISQILVGPVVVLRVDEKMDLIAGSYHTPWAKNALHVDQVYVGLAAKVTKLDRLQGWLGGTRKP